MEQYLKLSQVATRLHVCELTVSRWIRDEKIDVIELSPRRRLIPESSVQKFLDSKIVRPPQKSLDHGASPVKDSPNCSLKIEDHAGDERKTGEKSSKHWRKEIDRLCQ
jgi:hypothetical protein